MLRPCTPEPPTVPSSFALVGEHRNDPDRLLLLGEDGRYYGMRLPDGPAVPVEPDEIEWAVDPLPPPAEDPVA